MLLGTALVVGVLLVLHWYVSTEPKTLLRVLKWTGFAIAGGSLIVLAVTGRLGWALGMGALLLPWLMRLLQAARTARTFHRMASGATGETSSVETRFLRMTLDHDSGDVDGMVIEGPFAGRRLSDLDVAEVTTLLALCRRQDPQSAQILEAYLDRVHPTWRDDETGDADGGRRRDRGGEGTMTREEAFEVLGLQPGASEAEIKTAYHRLIAGLHPDKGGSTFLAAKVNQAKDVLLGR
ncbi:MAG: DnaJ domain-containing protein [Rhodospirillales bacterium]